MHTGIEDATTPLLEEKFLPQPNRSFWGTTGHKIIKL